MEALSPTIISDIFDRLSTINTPYHEINDKIDQVLKLVEIIIKNSKTLSNFVHDLQAEAIHKEAILARLLERNQAEIQDIIA